MALLGRTTPLACRLGRLFRGDDGQTVTEYAVVMGVITLVAVASITTVGGLTLDALRHVVASLR